MFVATFRNGRAHLSKVALAEHPKTYTVVDDQPVLGSLTLWPGKRIHKEDEKLRVFTSGKAALDYLHQQAQDYVVKAEERAQQARAQVAMLESVVNGEAA